MTSLFRRVLVPHDFSTHANRALAVAANLAAGPRSKLVILHVITPVYPSEGGVGWYPDAAFLASERRRLQQVAARVVKRRGMRADCRVEVGAPLERIVAAARGVDSIVMATAGRTGFSRLLIGSVAEQVVRHAPVPVLTLRSTARRARRRQGRRVSHGRRLRAARR
jgi:nucleotide-binding universal stress UspA family protein